jgi:hypothetical protein
MIKVVLVLVLVLVVRVVVAEVRVEDHSYGRSYRGCSRGQGWVTL